MNTKVCARLIIFITAALFATAACNKNPPPAVRSTRATFNNPAAPSRPGESSLLVPAAAAGDIEKVKQLLKDGADVNIRGPQNQTPLMEAAYAGETEIFRLLLDKGAIITLQKSDGATALSMALGGDKKEIVAMIQQVDQLLVASGKGDLSKVKELIAQKVSVNGRGENGRSALMEASYGDHLEVVKLLLQNGADPTFKKDDGATALSIARGGNRKKIVEALSAAGAKS
jgi:ankyrin repeat protein